MLQCGGYRGTPWSTLSNRVLWVVCRVLEGTGVLRVEGLQGTLRVVGCSRLYVDLKRGPRSRGRSGVFVQGRAFIGMDHDAPLPPVSDDPPTTLSPWTPTPPSVPLTDETDLPRTPTRWGLTLVLPTGWGLSSLSSTSLSSL